MNFNSPIWLYAGAAACAGVVAIYILAARRERNLLSRFASLRLLPELSRTVSKQKVFLKKFLFLISVALLFVAMARPQWGYR